jgi:glycosyltransferase involved in cell wall biosynthesis
MSTSILPLTVIVPTFRREQVLVDTLTDLLSLNQAPTEILVLDQTEKHEPETNEFLTTQAGLGKIRWLRLHEPSIPKAMNRGLLEASQDIVLFVDDDIRPEPDLLKAHLSAHANQPGGLIAGRVIQPWQENSDPIDSAGIQAEFAHRYRASGRQIYFEPLACLHHLKDVKGGTRTYGDHLTTWRPDHAVGAYYFGLRTRTMREFLVRPFRAITTRYHLRHPWRIPVTLLAELGGMLWALGLFMRGPKHLKSTENDTA